VLYQLSYCGNGPQISAGGGLGKEGPRPSVGQRDAAVQNRMN
jgi:hypothetical protein